MSKRRKLNGVVGAAVTPILPDGSIDVARLGLHCDRMLAGGCTYTSVFGTTGEGASFSVDERVDALSALAKAGMDMSRQIPGILTCSVQDAARLHRTAHVLGCRASLIIPPFYYAPTGIEGVVDFYTAVIDHAGKLPLEILLYNFPAFSRVTFTPDLIRAVCDRLGNLVIGVKDSTGDLEGGLTLIREFPDLAIFTGDDRILSRMRAAGGAGMIGGLVNLFPAANVALFEGQSDAAAEAAAASRISAIDGNGGLIAIKAALAHLYKDPAFAATAAPLRPLSAALKARVVSELGLNER